MTVDNRRAFLYKEARFGEDGTVELIERLKRQAIRKRGIEAQDALALFAQGAESPHRVLAAASEIREACRGNRISLCGISNAKSGRCSEDCAFCAQSGHDRTGASVFPLKPPEEIVAEAGASAREGAEWFGIVTSGKRLGGRREWQKVFKAIAGIRGLGLSPCASLGIIGAQEAASLKEAGLVRYHHNLETAASYFPAICTTHAYGEDVATVRAAKAAGLSVCSGGIIGLGEGMGQRIELALTLRELEVDSIPLNLFTPIPGTPLAGRHPLRPLEILMTIAVFRFLLPDREIRLCGGKERNLRQLLPLGLVAGADGLMTGSDLTAPGRDSALDREMVADLGLATTREAKPRCACEATGRKKRPGRGCAGERPGA